MRILFVYQNNYDIENNQHLTSISHLRVFHCYIRANFCVYINLKILSIFVNLLLNPYYCQLAVSGITYKNKGSVL